MGSTMDTTQMTQSEESVLWPSQTSMEQRSFITEPSPGSLGVEESPCSSMRGMESTARAGLGQAPVHSSKERHTQMDFWFWKEN